MLRPAEYENLIKMVQAILEFYEVRTKDAGRNLAIQRVSTSLGVTLQEFAFITRAHERRNGTSYLSPFPPVSKAEAPAVLSNPDEISPRCPCADRYAVTTLLNPAASRISAARRA